MLTLDRDTPNRIAKEEQKASAPGFGDVGVVQWDSAPLETTESALAVETFL